MGRCGGDPKPKARKIPQNSPELRAHRLAVRALNAPEPVLNVLPAPVVTLAVDPRAVCLEDVAFRTRVHSEPGVHLALDLVGEGGRD